METLGAKGGEPFPLTHIRYPWNEFRNTNMQSCRCLFAAHTVWIKLGSIDIFAKANQHKDILSRPNLQ